VAPGFAGFRAPGSKWGGGSSALDYFFAQAEKKGMGALEGRVQEWHGTLTESTNCSNSATNMKGQGPSVIQERKYNEQMPNLAFRAQMKTTQTAPPCKAPHLAGRWDRETRLQ